MACRLGSALVLAFKLARERPPTAFVDRRIRLGAWLAFALAFQLRVDIVATRPDSETLPRLALVAVIRSLLNYFRGRELAEQAPLKRRLTPPSPTKSAPDPP